MTRAVLLTLPLLLACRSGGNIDGNGETDTGDATVELDPEDFDEAMLRIIPPQSSALLPWQEQSHFQAELIDQDGVPLDYDEILWSSSSDAAWQGHGLDFTNADLDVGVHDITALAYLPNEDRVAHTVGGVLVQSPFAGTYVGLFVSTVDLDGLPIPCSGAAVLVVEPYGEQATGTASCVTSVMGMELELAYTFDLVNSAGRLHGIAGADIFGMFEYDFEVSDGTMDPDTMNFAFGGDVMGMLELSADVRVERISDDSGG